MLRDRREEGIAQGRLARKLDPLSSTVAAWTGVLPCYVGRDEEAIECLKQALPLDPDYWQLHYFLSEAYLHASVFEEAVKSAKKAVDLSGGASVAMVYLACSLYLGGRKGEGDEVFDSIRKRARERYVAPAKIALVHGAKGEKEAAVELLERAFEARDPWLCWYKLMPASIRVEDPRTAAIMERIGL